MKTILALCTLVLIAASACSSPKPPPGEEPAAGERVVIEGVVRHNALEGGFWSVVGNDGRTYEPMEELPEAFRQEGLPVRVEARLRPDRASFRMAGPIIEILDIRRR